MSPLVLLSATAMGILVAVCLKADVLIKLGGGVTDMRGSMGGNTFSRGGAGNYIRSRTKPVNPHSQLQNTRRAAVAYLTKYWSNNLTEQQRTDWRAYALATTWTNKLGETIEISGLSAFLRLNALEQMTPSAPIDEAPTAVGHGGGVTYTFTAEWDTSKIQVAEPAGAFDKDIDIMTLWFSMGIPAEAGRLAIPKGFRYIGRIWGSGGAPLSFPYELDAAFTMAYGQRVTLKCMFHDEHYRVSGPFYQQILATAA